MRRAVIRTTHEDPNLVAGAVRPDNTDEMTTRVAETGVDTTIERDSTAGLHTTLDDYLVNVIVAERTTQYGQTDTHTNPDNPETQQ